MVTLVLINCTQVVHVAITCAHDVVKDLHTHEIGEHWKDLNWEKRVAPDLAKELARASDEMKPFLENTDSLKKMLQDGVHSHGESVLKLPAAEVGHEAATYFDAALNAVAEGKDFCEEPKPFVMAGIAMVSAHTTCHLFTLLFYSVIWLDRYCGPLCRAAQKREERQRDQQVRLCQKGLQTY